MTTLHFIVLLIVALLLGGLLIAILIIQLFTIFINQLNHHHNMANIKELSDKVDALQAALDAEQEQIKAAIDTLTATVEQLRLDVVDGGTAEERQLVADKIEAVITDLKGTIPDAEPEPGL